jgi:hypothetical protein
MTKRCQYEVSQYEKCMKPALYRGFGGVPFCKEHAEQSINLHFGFRTCKGDDDMEAITGHRLHCSKCDVHLTFLGLCGKCGHRYDLPPYAKDKTGLAEEKQPDKIQLTEEVRAILERAFLIPVVESEAAYIFERIQELLKTRTEAEEKQPGSLLEISRLDINEGDTLVVKVLDGPISQEGAERMKKEINAILPEVRVLIFDHDVELLTIRLSHKTLKELREEDGLNPPTGGSNASKIVVDTLCRCKDPKPGTIVDEAEFCLGCSLPRS